MLDPIATKWTQRIRMLSQNGAWAPSSTRSTRDSAQVQTSISFSNTCQSQTQAPDGCLEQKSEPISRKAQCLRDRVPTFISPCASILKNRNSMSVRNYRSLNHQLKPQEPDHTTQPSRFQRKIYPHTQWKWNWAVVLQVQLVSFQVREITKSVWPIRKLPHNMVSDRAREKQAKRLKWRCQAPEPTS